MYKLWNFDNHNEKNCVDFLKITTSTNLSAPCKIFQSTFEFEFILSHCVSYKHWNISKSYIFVQTLEYIRIQWITSLWLFFVIFGFLFEFVLFWEGRILFCKQGFFSAYFSDINNYQLFRQRKMSNNKNENFSLEEIILYNPNYHTWFSGISAC